MFDVCFHPWPFACVLVSWFVSRITWKTYNSCVTLRTSQVAEYFDVLWPSGYQMSSLHHFILLELCNWLFHTNAKIVPKIIRLSLNQCEYLLQIWNSPQAIWRYQVHNQKTLCLWPCLLHPWVCLTLGFGKRPFALNIFLKPSHLRVNHFRLAGCVLHTNRRHCVSCLNVSPCHP